MLGAQTVLGIGSVIGLALLAVGLVPRSTRELGLDDPAVEIVAAHAIAASAPGSAEQRPGDVRVEAGRKA